MKTLDIINLFGAALAIVLGVISLWLALYFYRRSVEELRRGQASAESLSTSIERIEALFDAMYSDTFSMMKDTVSDMRAHIWLRADKDAQDDGRGRNINASIGSETVARDSENLVDNIERLVSSKGIDHESAAALASEISPQITDALRQSSELGADFQAEIAFTKSTIQAYVRSRGGRQRSVTMESLQNFLIDLGYDRERITGHLRIAEDEGWLRIDGGSLNLVSLVDPLVAQPSETALPNVRKD